MRLTGLSNGRVYKLAHKVLGQFKSYYRYVPGMSIEEITEKWVKNNELIDEHAYPIMMPVDDLWPYREYKWTREEARLSPEEWDALAESMKQGWQEGSWLTLNIGRDGWVKLGEGNHRLAIAKQIGMEEIPVAIWFMQSVGSGVQVIAGYDESEEEEKYDLDYDIDDEITEEDEERTQEVVDRYTTDTGDWDEEALLELLGLK